MPLRGAAIGPDAVLVWTGTRELTRFDRSGARASFTVPLPPLAAHVDALAGLRIVDNRGTLHRYSLIGEHVGATPLRAGVGAIEAAAIAASRDRIALIVDEEALVFEAGVPVEWRYDRPSDGYRETTVGLSDDGDSLLVGYETFAYFTGFGSGGSSGTGFFVLDRAGTRRIEQVGWSMRDAVSWISPDGNHVVCDEALAHGRYLYAVGIDGNEWSLTDSGPVQLAFHGGLVAALLDRELHVVELATRRSATLEVPERFTDVVMTGDNLVLVHAELGTWWIPLSTLIFEAYA